VAGTFIDIYKEKLSDNRRLLLSSIIYEKTLAQFYDIYETYTSLFSL